MSDGRAKMLREMARAEQDQQRRHALMLGARCIDQQFKPAPPRPDRPADYYALTPCWVWRDGDPGGKRISTAAVVTCCITGKMLDGMGGGGLFIDATTLAGLRSGELVAVPRKLTAENGMKAALIGEFQVPFPHHDADGCEVVSQVNVPWTTIKKIHDAVVIAAAPEAPGRAAIAAALRARAEEM